MPETCAGCGRLLIDCSCAYAPSEHALALEALERHAPRESCPTCPGDASPLTTCPRSITCPRCHARAGARCKRPSGHPANELHAERTAAAERLDIDRARGFALGCEACGAPVSIFDSLTDGQLNESGEIRRLCPSCARPDDDQGEQLGLLEVAPTTTFRADYGAAPAPLSTSALF